MTSSQEFHDQPHPSTGGPAVRRTRSNNPAWATDELILALEVYLRQRGHIPSPRDAEIVELSDLLNGLPIHAVRPDLEKFRNPNGVVLKITNFAALDRQYPGVGMSRGSRLDAVVWDRYSGDQDQLRQVADAIRGAAESSILPAVPEADEGEIEAEEGRLLVRVHRVRERDRTLVQRKKAAAFARQGSLPCEVCGFDFAITYGTLGEQFIEAHHILGRCFDNKAGRPCPGLLELSPYAAPGQHLDQSYSAQGTPAR